MIFESSCLYHHAMSCSHNSSSLDSQPLDLEFHGVEKGSRNHLHLVSEIVFYGLWVEVLFESKR